MSRITKRDVILYILNLYEGIYSNDADDKGKETYRGISRRAHPQWRGWALIDSVKGKPDFKEVIINSTALKEWAIDFYIKEYWKDLLLYTMPEEIAAEVFEQAINFGKKRAVKHLQRAANALRYDTKLEELQVDGVMGAKTIRMISAIEKRGRANKLLRAFNSLQGCRYVELMEKSESQLKYTGWFDRIDISLYRTIERKYYEGMA